MFLSSVSGDVVPTAVDGPFAIQLFALFVAQY